MKQKLLNFLPFLESKKERFKEVLPNEISERNRKISSCPKLFLAFFLLSFVLFSSNLQAQITVNPTSFCSGVNPAPSVTISIGINGGVSPYTVSYKIGTGATIIKTNYIKGTPISVPLPLATTTYTVVSIVDRTGATIPISGSPTATITVLPRPAIPTITADGPTTFCQGESVTLTSSPGTTYKWTTPQGTFLTQSVIASAAGSYTVQITNANGCTSITSVAKTITITPLATPAIETIIPPNCLVTTGSVVLSGLPATGTWTINPGAITGTGTKTTVSGLSIGNHKFTVTNQSGCVSLSTSDVVMKMESPPTEVPVLNAQINGCKSSFTQTWKSVPEATGYLLDVATDPDFKTFLSGYENKELTNVTSEIVTGITAGTTYYVRLKAINSCGTTEYSNNITVSPITTTYENGVWSNGLPDSTKSIVFNSDYNINTDMNGCSCQVNTGANIGVQSGITLKLENGLTVNGSLTFENNASLVQINDVQNSGNVTYKRTTAPMKLYDYTYWSSPVKGQVLRDLSYNSDPGHYESFINNAWFKENSSSEMTATKGYIIIVPERGPWANGEIVNYPYEQKVNFIGVPNNGHQEYSPYTGQWNLIGNPYPSAIDADLFFENNKDVLAGTLFFWTHNTPPRNSSAENNIYRYNQDDYAAYNILGGIATAAPTGSTGGLNNSKPTGKIAAGQSFMIKNVNAGKVVFDNNMRVSGENTQFYKHAKTNKIASREKHRLWLNFTNTQGAFKQILIGYASGATNDYDDRFDGKVFSVNSFVNFYSINSGFDLSIQGRVLPFEDTDIIPLGYETIIAGEFNIAIDEVDGLLKNKSIYLEDKKTNSFHNLKNSDYTFNTEIGTFNDRFVIHYIPNVIETPVLNNVAELTCNQASFILNWNAIKNASSYRLDVATDEEFTNFVSGFQDRELGNYTSEEITGLTETKYFIRLRAMYNSVASPNSNVVTIDPIATTYENGVWSNGIPDGSKTVIFNSNYDITTDMNACSCKVNAGANVTVAAGVVLKLENGLNVDETSTLTFENEASLVQVNESPNTGKIIYKRTSSPMKIFDFTYWSSPVIGQKLNVLSPDTLFNNYLSFDNGKWVNENGNAQMIPAKGYIIQAPKQGRGSNGEVVSFPYSQPVQFIGVPNNGHQEFISDGTGFSNLIGNPYPSAINADLFLDTNSDILAGTIYLWTRNSSYLQNIFNPDDYASYNVLGGIATAGSSSDSGTLKSTKPNGKIAAGQSFFIESINSGIVTFNNSMRVSGQNTLFFKQGQTNKRAAIEKHRFWLNFTSKQGTFKQILIGYMTGATNDYDSRFDGKTWDRNPFVNFYTTSSGKNLSIEGRALPFDNTDVISLGYRATIGGTFSIAIDQVDGLFTDQAIYLEDKMKNAYHNLKDGAYTFSTFGGTFNNRFVVHYITPNTVPDTSSNSNKIIVSVANNQITVNSSRQKIQKVAIYDLNGRLILEKENVNSTIFLTDKLAVRKQILIVKTTLENAKTNTDLVIF